MKKGEDSVKVLMLSWEYPPYILGGLGKHVYALSGALADLGVDVHIITKGELNAPEYEEDRGVHIYRAPYYSPPPRDFHTMVLQTNLNMAERAFNVARDFGDVDIIHGHDWLVAHACKLLKHTLRRPLVATVHATEWGRNQGLHNDLQRYISDVEWWFMYEAWRVICCSEYMKNELRNVFQVPDDKINIIRNGVDVGEFESEVHTWEFKERFASEKEKLVFFVGRLVREKGVDVLLEAIPRILSIYPDVKFVIAGRGPSLEDLKIKSQALGIANKVYFTGYIDDETRNGLYKCAEVAVVPSLYEPFGIVALEAMAAKAPVIVSDVGGLGEVVREDIGVKVIPGDVNSLAEGILKILHNPHRAAILKENGYNEVINKYNWKGIARDTLSVFSEVFSEYKGSLWQNLQPFAEHITRPMPPYINDVSRYRETH